MAIQLKHTLQVKDLIAALEKLDPNLHIYGFSDDPDLVSRDEAYKIFSVDSVNAQNVEKGRDDLTGMPSLKFSTAEGSQEVAFVNMSYRF